MIINPVSKIAILSASASDELKREIADTAVKSTLVAGAILFASVLFGDFLMRRVFHIQLESLQISGGFVLAWVGFNALRKGIFFDVDQARNFPAMAIVPLACPLIAGPATISACITMGAEHAVWPVLAALSLALAGNLVFMKFSRPIGSALTHYNILGAIIRITGLVVMTMGVQMVCDGIKRQFMS